MNNINIQQIRIEDKITYFHALSQIDEESRYFTKTLKVFTFDEIEKYLQQIVKDNSRKDFIMKENDIIIGEVVLTEITNKACHFRICLFNKQYYSKGIGQFASNWIINYAFKKLKVSEIELEVFPFNKRAIGLYKKLGFSEECTYIDDEADEPYKEIIIMKLQKQSN